MLLTLKDAVVVQQLFKHILHHILSIGCAAAIMHRSAVDGVAVTLHRQGKNFVSGQLSHCYKLSLDARKRASRWNVCGSHGDVHSIYGSASPIIAEQNPVPSIFCVPDAPAARHVHVLRRELDILPVYRSVYHGIAKRKRGEPFLIYRPFAAAPAARRERSQPWGGAASICRLCCAPVSAPVRQGRCQSPSRPAWSIAG